MSRYPKNPDATKEAITSDRWFRVEAAIMLSEQSSIDIATLLALCKSIV